MATRYVSGPPGLLVGMELALRSEERDEAGSNSGLTLDHPGLALGEEGLIGGVATEFDAAQEAFNPLVFVGTGELVEGLSGSGREANGIAEVLVTAGESNLAGDLFVSRKGDTGPVGLEVRDLSARGELMTAVVVVDVCAELRGGREQQGSIEKVGVTLLGASVGWTGVVVCAEGVLGLGESANDADRYAAVAGSNIVPSVDNLDTGRDGFAERHGCTQTKVVVRDSPCKEQRTGVVPVILSFNDFSTGGGDELTEVSLKSLGLGGLVADESLLNEIIVALRAEDGLFGGAKKEINMDADRIGIVIDGELGSAEAEGIGIGVEVVELVAAFLNSGAICVVAVVAIHKAGEVNGSYTPGWGRRGCVGRCRGSGRRGGSGSSLRRCGKGNGKHCRGHTLQYLIHRSLHELASSRKGL